MDKRGAPQMRKYLWPIVFGAVGLVVFAMSMMSAYTAHSQPGMNCGGGGFIGWGSYCDSDYWPDGSKLHCVSGGGPFAWGSRCDRVCDSPPGNPLPPITDSDPNTRCPGY